MAVELTPSQKQTLDSLCDKTPADAKFLWTLLKFAMLSYNGILQVITNTGGGSGGAVTIADGADVALGSIADAAATAGGAGTVEAKLRLMTTQLASLNTNTPATVSRTPTCVAHTAASGNTAAGSQRTTFLASSDFVGTLLGAAFAGGAAITMAPKGQDTVAASAWTRSAGTLFEYRLD